MNSHTRDTVRRMSLAEVDQVLASKSTADPALVREAERRRDQLASITAGQIAGMNDAGDQSLTQHAKGARPA